MENDILKIALSSSSFPPLWPYCFNSSCTRRDTCLHYRAALALDAAVTSGPAVYPAAATLDDCPHFKLARTIRTAWGFARLFYDVRAADAPILRKNMKAFLGGNGGYYRYHHGKWRLKPDQQTMIRRLFERYGYHNAEFDHYQTEIDV